MDLAGLQDELHRLLGEMGQSQSSAPRHNQTEGLSRFVALPDVLHRLVSCSLRQGDVHHVASSCKSLGAVYREGIRSFRPSWRGCSGSLSEESLVRYLERLPCLERIVADTYRGIELLGSAAVASSVHGGAPWLTTPHVLDLSESERASRFGPYAGKLRRIQDGADASLLTLLGLVGQGTWPRLQRLTIAYIPELLRGGLEALVVALESRGDAYGMLQELELSTSSGSSPADTERLQDEGLLRRLLASPCCGELEVLKIHLTIHLSTPSFAELVSYLRSPRRLQSLTCHWSPARSEGVADPAMLIKALADGCLSTLQALEVSRLHSTGAVSPEAASALFRWAEGPFSRSLQVFKCESVLPSTFRPLMEGMRAAHGFPVLKSLEVGHFAPSGPMIEELCLSMEAGAMPCLESLTLPMMDGRGLVRVMRWLSGNTSRCSPRIKKLEARCCFASDEDGEAMGRALADGACPSLQHLSLAYSALLSDRTARSMADALRGGAAEGLRILSLDRTSLGDEGCLALRDVMQEGGTALRHVSFIGSRVTGERGRYGRLEMEVDGHVLDGEVREERYYALARS